LFWDAGRGFEMETLRTSGVVVVLVSLVLTFAAWLAGYGLLGAG
jgi:succinate dehydrogenase/fumarate reductase cytochrome b subunit